MTFPQQIWYNIGSRNIKNNMNYETILIISPIALALTEVVKRVLGWEKEDNNSSRFLPLISMTLGIFGAWIVLPDGTYLEIIINGLLAGLTASGFYDISKIVRK